MKKLINLFTGLFLLVFTASCYDGIDPITEVDPGPDAGSPQVTHIFPEEGTTIQDISIVSTINIKFDVVDDIEIVDVKVYLDNVLLGSYDSFMDYRIFHGNLVKEGLLGGDHILKVVATDLTGNITTSEVTFTKAPPYTPLFDSEMFYMPFDSNYFELMSIQEATKVGNPGFAGESFSDIDGTNAFKGAADSYLTFPMGNSLGTSFTGMFWYKVSATPDRAGLLVMGNNVPEDRTKGFRLFREGSATSQRIKLNVGTGTGESWNDGGLIDVTAGEWVNVAFTVTPTQTKIYLNGVQVNTATMSAAIDWTGCNSMTIGSGAPTFSYWSHGSDRSPMDELRFFDEALTVTQIQDFINLTNPYSPIYDETLYMPFENNYADLVTNTLSSTVGAPSFSADAYAGSNSYLGTTDSYLTFPLTGLFGTQEFSTTFWYKVSGSPDRAGLITVGTSATEDRNHGFRIFREGSATSQRIKLNVGTGTGESWNDGGVIDVTDGAWVHIAVTVSATESKIYFNGVLQLTGTLSAPVSWTDCGDVVIGSGGPTFSYWNHLSDQSPMDDLRFYNRTLTATEIADML